MQDEVLCRASSCLRGRERPRDVLLLQLQASRDACRLPQSDDEAVGRRHAALRHCAASDAQKSEHTVQ